jgi:hypothetical protein
MFDLFEKHSIFGSILFISVALALLLLWPELSRPISMAILMVSVCMAMIAIVHKHWQTYKQAKITLKEMTRNLSLDTLGLLLTMSAASFAGGATGQWAGAQAGVWAGMLQGFVVGFLAAWTVRSVWGKLAGKLISSQR